MFHSLVPRELLTERMEFLFITDGVCIWECKVNTSTILPATQVQGLRNAYKSLPFFPHCKACPSYVIVPETLKAQKTLNTSKKTSIDSFPNCKGKVTQDIGATLQLSCSVFLGMLSVLWLFVFCTEGLYKECWEGHWFVLVLSSVLWHV